MYLQILFFLYVLSWNGNAHVQVFCSRNINSLFFYKVSTCTNLWELFYCKNLPQFFPYESYNWSSSSCTFLFWTITLHKLFNILVHFSFFIYGYFHLILIKHFFISCARIWPVAHFAKKHFNLIFQRRLTDDSWIPH